MSILDLKCLIEAQANMCRHACTHKHIHKYSYRMELIMKILCISRSEHQVLI